MGEQIFSRLKAHKNEVLEHLFKIYRAVLMAGADGDYQFLKEYCEETFLDAYIKRLEELKQNRIQVGFDNLKLIVEEDKRADSGRPMQVIANIYDHTVIKGLSIKRKENGSESQYSILNDIEDLGFISYIPKYIQDPRNFVDPEKNKVIHSQAHKIVFRAYVEIKSGLQIFLKDQNLNDLFEYPDDYTWRHVAVFESPMKPPTQANVWKEQESLMEWITKHTFGPWYLVDLDNWLAGNPLVIPKFTAGPALDANVGEI